MSFLRPSAPRRTARRATILAAAAAAAAALAGPVTAAAASPATAAAPAAAPAAPALQIFESFTSLNLGKGLSGTFNASGAIGTTPDTSTFQQWGRVKEFGIPAVAGHVVPYRMKNRFNGLCLQDVGDGKTLAERTCHTHVTTGCAQLFHNHSAPDRVVNGLNYYTRYARTSGRVMAVAPQFGTTVPVLARTGAGNPGTANEALALWTTKNVAVG